MNLTVKTYLQDHSIDLADILENEAKVAKKKKKKKKEGGLVVGRKGKTLQTKII